MTREHTLQPDPRGWIAAVRADRPDPIGSIRTGTRDTLGFDADAPVVATGHQASIWHPGILAKDLALAGMVDTDPGLRPVHFIADHDADEGGLVALPSGSGSSLRRMEWHVLPAANGRGSRDRPAGPCGGPPAGDFLPSVAAGIDAIRVAIEAGRNSENAAMQLGGAAANLAAPWTGTIPRRTMSHLLETPVGAWILDRLATDPEAAALAHDRAVEAHRQDRGRMRGGRLPRGVARRLARNATLELPLWRTTPEGRVPVLAGEPLDPATLRPRALLATAMTRLAACDGFVHGLGGGIYDEAMEGWIRGWLGPEHADALAPVFVATATGRLPLEAPAFDPEGDPTRLHRLRNDPDLGRSESPLRPRLLDAIAAAPVGSAARRAAFRELRLAIDAARRSNAGALAATAAAVRSQAGRRMTMTIATDRTWAFPLHAAKDLDELSSSIRPAFA
ncbi:MAG: hypothetical protein CMJ27_02715 [Phycisphaerae bacterium]|nr:hypothetical protein [Phycisphaerae bacterium]